MSISVLLLFTGIWLFFSFSHQQKNIVAQQQLVAEQTANTVNRFIQDKIETMEKTVDLVDVVAADIQQKRAILEKLLGKENSFRQIILLNKQKQALVRISRLSKMLSAQLMQYNDEDLFSAMNRKEKYVGPIFIDKMSYEPMMVMGVPVINVFKELDGVLLAEVNLKFMWDLIEGIKIGKNGLSYVVDNKGMLIAFKDISRVLKGENLTYLKEVKKFLNDKQALHNDSSAEISKGIQGSLVLASHIHLGTPDWAVITELPIMEAYNSIVLQVKAIIIILAFIFLLSFFLGWNLAKRITKPIITLKDATEKIRKGELDTKIEIESKNEIGELADSFNQMIKDLSVSTTSIENLNREIVERKKAEEKLRQTHMQLIQSEKLASIGQLAAGVAHEINNPVGFIMSNSDTILKYIKRIYEIMELYAASAPAERIAERRKELKIDYIMEDMLTMLKENNEGLERVVSIVKNLRDFSRIDTDREMAQININECLKSTLIVAHNNIKYVADVKTDFGSIDPVFCNAGEINQVFLNILVNAAQAIKDQDRNGRGNITVSTRQDEDSVVCEISDNGPGIPKEVLPKIFDPFFTTKEVGKGTGLGLSISYDIIVNKHKGQISVESEVGKGTRFFITLPKSRAESDTPKAVYATEIGR